MAPLYQAINAQFARKSDNGEVWVYQGDVDRDWVVMAVPNGGYVLGLIIEAAMRQQASTSHPDPIHVTAHFIRSASIEPFEVHIRVLKAGRGFSNLTANFVQSGQTRVMTHMIFGTLSESASSNSDNTQPNLTVAPPSPHARRIPMYTHPSKCAATPPRRRWQYKEYMRLADDPVHVANAKIPKEGMEWGMYLTLMDPGERITTPSIAFLADTFKALDEIIPGVHSQTRTKSWAPTMVMSIEFKFPIPKRTNPDHSPRTVAIYSSGKFMNDPQARHDTYVEVWTAPSNIGEGTEKEGWRENQRCLAVASQMALLVSMEVNKKKGRKAESQSKL